MQLVATTCVGAIILCLHQSTIIRNTQGYQSGKLKNESGESSEQLNETQAQ